MAFTHEEYVRRQERARELMDEVGMTALFLTDPATLFYYTGFPFSAERSFPRPAALVLPRDQPAALVLHNFHFPCPWRGEVIEYERIGALPVSLVAEVIEARGAGTGAIGAELGHEQQLAIAPQDYAALIARLANARFVDASAILWRQRQVKTQAEVNNISEACHAHDRIFGDVFEHICTGMTTHDIDRWLQHRAIEAGARGAGAIICIGPFVAEQRAGSSAAERALGAGEMVWIDLSLGWNGYRTDYCRAAIAAGPRSAQRDRWQRVHEVLLAGFEAVRPGRPISEVCRAELDAAERLGLDMRTWMARRYGHSSGIHTTEPPSVSLDDDTELRPNMVIHLEPGVIADDGIYVREEMVLVTEQGCRFLSHAPWQLATI